MQRTTKALILSVLLSSPGAALGAASASAPQIDAGGDAEAGGAKATVCAACHGQEGKAILPSYPNLGGQHYEYLVYQLRMFKSGARYAQLMAGQVDNLAEQDLKDLAAYYSAKPIVEQEAAAEGLDLGERIYRAGLPDKGVPACIACHSPRGLGNGPAAFPVLSGQNADYVAAQLNAYRAGERTTDERVGGMMRGVADSLDDDEITAVSNYVQGLH